MRAELPETAGTRRSAAVRGRRRPQGRAALYGKTGVVTCDDRQAAATPEAVSGVTDLLLRQGALPDGRDRHGLGERRNAGE